MSVPQFFESDRAGIEEALDRLLPKEEAHPASIHKAMRYSVFAGGKRIRPILCLEAASMFSENPVAAVSAGCALQFLPHTSLIHDDLPALDNDDFRRGKPTCHKVFGEAMAILAGDALLTLAFQTLAFVPVEAQRRLNILATIAQAAGTDGGMIGGQVADLEAEKKPPDAGTLEYIHRSKTAALIRASIVAGGIAGGAANEDVERLRRFGENIGWAFQVVDDILDVEESSAALGKTAGEDAGQQKATYPGLLGLTQSREVAAELLAKAVVELQHFGARGKNLRELAEFLVERRS